MDMYHAAVFKIDYQQGRTYIAQGILYYSVINRKIALKKKEDTCITESFAVHT